jgi:hypothetical protein
MAVGYRRWVSETLTTGTLKSQLPRSPSSDASGRLRSTCRCYRSVVTWPSRRGVVGSAPVERCRLSTLLTGLCRLGRHRPKHGTDTDGLTPIPVAEVVPGGLSAAFGQGSATDDTVPGAAHPCCSGRGHAIRMWPPCVSKTPIERSFRPTWPIDVGADPTITADAPGRIGQPDDIAPVAVFLASNDARWVTGEILAVSGGM